jgi:transcriptional regulator with XRE-family HTH domain
MLSQTLKKLRENSGYTQQQVANALSIERSTYTYYETGKTTPDINTIIKLSKIFNISYTEMLENEERECCKSLNDSCDDLYSCYDSKDFNHVYELSKKEKTLISLYRVLPIEIQNKILKELKEEVDRD